MLDFTGALLTAIFFAVEKSQKEDKEDKENFLFVLDGAVLNSLGSLNQGDRGIFMPTSFETLLRLRAAEAANFKQLLLFPDIIKSARFNGIKLNEKNKRKIAEKLCYPVAVYPNMDNSRIFAQDGRFVIWGGKEWPDFYGTGKDSEYKTESLCKIQESKFSIQKAKFFYI